MTDIDIRLNKVGYLGAWDTDHPDTVILNIAEIWKWNRKNAPKQISLDGLIDRFAKKLDLVFLQERVCQFKTSDNIRIKGGQCKTYCRHEKLVDLMCHPTEWSDIREFHRKKKISYLGVQ